MVISNYTTRVLEASEGFFLTQTGDVELQDRVITKKVFLATTAKKEDWKEISKNEGEALLKQKEELRKNKRAEVAASIELNYE